MGIIKMLSPDNVVFSVGGIYYLTIPGNVKVVTPQGSGLRDGSGWGNSMGLSELVKELESTAYSTTIYWLGAGTYALTDVINLARNGITLYGGFNNTEISLDERDSYLNKTNFSGSNVTNIFDITNIKSLTIDGVNFINGHAKNGGALYVCNSTITLKNCDLYDNVATGYGGAIYEENNSKVTLINCNIYDNTAGSGGGVYVNTGSTITTENTDIYDNGPDDSYPDIILTGIKTVTLNGGSTIKTGLGDGTNNWDNAMSFAGFISEINSGVIAGPNNTKWSTCEYWIERGDYTLSTPISINKAGISIYGGFTTERKKKERNVNNFTTFNCSTTSAVNISGTVNTKLDNNVIDSFIIKNATASAVKANYVTNTWVNNCKFISNKGVDGAGLNISNSEITLEKCVISGNDATGNGGGVYSSNSNTNIINSTVDNNTAKIAGGIYFNNGTENVSCLINSTVSENKIISGGSTNGIGVYNNGVSVITNDIIYNNGNNTSLQNYYNENNEYVGRVVNCLVGGSYLDGTNIISDNPNFTNDISGSQDYYKPSNENLKIGQYIDTVAYNNIKIPVDDQVYNYRNNDDFTTVGSIEIFPVASKKNHITSLVLNCDYSNVTIYQTKRIITPVILPTNATKKVLRWFSSNPSVATVTNDGLATFIGSGIVHFTATTTDGSSINSNTHDITSALLVYSMTISGSTDNIPSGDTRQFTALVFPDTAVNKNVTWSSSNTAIATINSAGLATFIEGGTVKFTATAADGSGVSASTAYIEVTQLVDTITITGDYTTAHVDEIRTYSSVAKPDTATNKVVSWASSDETIATINSSGIATFLKIGTVQFTATTTDGSNKTAITSAIQVIQYVTSIVVNETLTSATTSNTSVTLTATVKPDNANTKTVAWSSSDGAIATINATTGKVTFLSSGKVTFTATAQDGSRVKGNSKEITVTAA